MAAQHYQPPQQALAGQLFDTVFLVVLVYLVLFAPLILGLTGGGTYILEVAETRAGRRSARTRRCRRSGKSWASRPRPPPRSITKRFDYTINPLALILTAVVVVGYFWFVVRLSRQRVPRGHRRAVRATTERTEESRPWRSGTCSNGRLGTLGGPASVDGHGRLPGRPRLRARTCCSPRARASSRPITEMATPAGEEALSHGDQVAAPHPSAWRCCASSAPAMSGRWGSGIVLVGEFMGWNFSVAKGGALGALIACWVIGLALHLRGHDRFRGHLDRGRRRRPVRPGQAHHRPA